MNRIIIAIVTAMTFLSGMQQSKAQATQEYYVNLVLDRKNVTLDVWTQAWQSFRDSVLPTLSGGPGTGTFDIQVTDQRAVFQLSNVYTSNFPQTYAEFQSIPSQLPPIAEFSVRVDGPYLGRPGSLGSDTPGTPGTPAVPLPGGDINIDGRGDNTTGTTVQKTVKAGGTWRVTMTIQNDTDVAQEFQINITGSMVKKKSGCKVKVLEGRSKGTVRQSGKSIFYTTPVLRPGQSLPVGIIITPPPASGKDTRTKTSFVGNIVANPAVLGDPDNARLICIRR